MIQTFLEFFVFAKESMFARVSLNCGILLKVLTEKVTLEYISTFILYLYAS